ncbi:MAG: hypothetical protein PUC65_03335 [Clostridiales bacterium]|nr:hypothetical protein [Clostridiales bacterium]
MSGSSVYYSVGTLLAWKIAHDFYDNVHFVWCTTEFDSIVQPPTSNPKTILTRYLEQITTGDVHTQEVQSNVNGILRGAKHKLDNGTITQRQFEFINLICANATYEAFFPVIYVIDAKKVAHKVINVPDHERASANSVEKKIVDLMQNEFTLINCWELFGRYIKCCVKEVR